MDVDLAQDALAAIDEPVRLAGVDDRHVTRPDLDRGRAVGEGRSAFEHDQDLGVRMPVQARPVAWLCVHVQNARANAAMLLTDEVSRDDVSGQLFQVEDADRHKGRC